MIAKKTWREVRVLVFAYLVILELLCIPVLLLWPDIYPDLQRSSLLRNIGIDWIARAGKDLGQRNEDVAYLSWCAIMLFFRSANLVGTAAAVLLGTGLFARERENQTFESLLALPVSRGRMLWQKVWPPAIGLVLPIYLVNASAIFWSRRIDLDLPPWELFLASTHAAAFALLFFLLTTWLSIRLRVQAHVAAGVGAFAVLQIGLYLTQRIRPYSIFHLADYDWYGPILAGNTPAWQMFDPIRSHGFTTWILLACVVAYGLAWRDLRKAVP
jgi:ABC-2 type transport system permease protein